MINLLNRSLYEIVPFVYLSIVEYAFDNKYCSKNQLHDVEYACYLYPDKYWYVKSSAKLITSFIILFDMDNIDVLYLHEQCSNDY